MKLKTLALACASTFVVGCATQHTSSVNQAPAAELSTPYTLKSGGEISERQKHLSISHAKLAFSFDFDKEIVFGNTTLTLQAPLPQQEISVDLDTRFAIESVWLNGTELPAEQFSNLEGELIVSPNSSVAFPATLRIVYSGHPRTPIRAPWDGGVMWEETPDGHPWLATAVQGEGCDLFWPCIDQPYGEPANTELFITVPKPLVAASNGVLVATEEKGNDRTFHWQTKSMHNTYGIALNIAPYEKLTKSFTSIYGNTYPLTYYHLPENEEKAEALFAELPEMITFFERMIGPYPFANEKVGIVQTPHLGMEHQTINAYGNEYRKDDAGYDWLMQHEFAHEWFGNQLTNDNWDHMWLHEGFGTYMQPLYAQYLHGNEAYFVKLNAQRKGLANAHPIVSNELMSEEDVYEKGPAGDIYAKGSWVIHTLRGLMGDEPFFRSVTELVYGRVDPQPGNFEPIFANTQDFIDIVNKNSEHNLDWFFDVYIFSAALPILDVARTENEVTFTWKTEGDLPFPMPLEVSVNGKVTTLDMQNQTSLMVTEYDVVVADPNSKVLRYEQRFEDYKAWQEAQAEMRKKQTEK
ncbi:MAG: peptidase M1 [Alteromonas sp.]|nr:MAG: peptidase M1 [Alteromonas sp.]